MSSTKVTKFDNINPVDLKPMHPAVQQKFDNYPADIAKVLIQIRSTIYAVADQEEINAPEETVKWGEPSYMSKSGSTIRYDWKAKTPDKFYLYFNCKTKLVETFKEVYGDYFIFQGNRAIVFCTNEEIAWQPLKHCISMALRYHKIKHLPLLGA